MTLRKRHSPETLSFKARLAVTALIPATLFLIFLSLYFISIFLIPLYERLYRGAAVIETPYIIFALIGALPIFALGTVAVIIAASTGRKFNPEKGSRLFKFQHLMFAAAIKTLLYLVPAAIIITTLLLLARGYWPCGKLYIPDSFRQLYWVNDERVCFKPDHYINDNWPCKIVNGKDVCIQVDGR